MRKLVCLIVLFVLGSQYALAQYVDDLYVPTKQRDENLKEQKQYNQQLKEENLARALEQKRRQAEEDRSHMEFTNAKYDEYVDDVKTAYQRRADALSSNSTNSTSFWEAMDSYYEYLEAKYDRDLYNIIVINDKIWVEPKYISSIFDGSDPTQGLDSYKNRTAKNYIQKQKYNSGSTYGNSGSNVNLNIVVSPFYGGYSYYSGWYSPWNSWCDPWYRPYGSYWSGGWYNPWYRPYWGGGWYNPWYSSWYRPSYIDSHPVYHGNSRNNYYGNRRGGYSGNSSSAGSYENRGGGSTFDRPGSSNGGFGRANQLPSQRPENRPSNSSGMGNGSNFVRGMGGGTRTDNTRPNYNNNNDRYQNNSVPQRQPEYRPAQQPTFNPAPSSSGSGMGGGGYRGGGGGGRTR